jgi:peptide/nickel transport system substrate-binding protein
MNVEQSYWDRMTNGRTIRRRRLLGAASSGLVGAALLAACGSDDGGDEGSSQGAASDLTGTGGEFSPSQGTPTPGGRFVFTSTQNANFNALSDWTEGNVLSGALVYDRPLTAREDSRRYVLEAAESIEQPGPLRAVLKLKPGMTFHDVAPVSGRGVKASDIRATQEFIATLPNAFDKTFVSGYLDRMEVTDDRTLVFHLKKPMGYLFNMAFLGSGTGQPIIPAETLGPTLTTGKQIGSGPYMADTAELGVGAAFRKNPRFREASKNLPYIAEREFKVINDPIAYETAFRAGQLDWVQFASVNAANSVKKDLPGKVVYELAGIADNVFRWNMVKPENPWKQDVRVREAIWRLTNRQQLLDLAYSGAGVMTYGLVPAALKEWLPDRNEVEPYWQEDVAKATQLLKAANWNPDREVMLLVSSSNTAVMEIYQQQLQRGGMKSTIDTYTGLGKFFERLGAGTYDAFSDQTPGSGDPYVSLRHQHSDSWSDIYRGFALYDKSIDAMIEKSEQTLDREENVSLVKQIQLECMKQFTLSYILYTLNRNYLLQTRVQNFDLSVATPLARHDAWLKA